MRVAQAANASAAQVLGADSTNVVGELLRSLKSIGVKAEDSFEIAFNLACAAYSDDDTTAVNRYLRMADQRGHELLPEASLPPEVRSATYLICCAAPINLPTSSSLFRDCVASTAQHCSCALDALFCVQEVELELAVVQAQMAHMLVQQGKHAEALDRYLQLLALDLQYDIVTAALCTNNMLALKALTMDSVPKVRSTGMQACAHALPLC